MANETMYNPKLWGNRYYEYADDLDCRKTNGAGMQKKAKTESIWHQKKGRELESFTLLECPP